MFDLKSMSELLTVLAAVLATVTMGMSMVFYFQSKKNKERYDSVLKKIEIEKMRQELEQKIYDLNYKLSEDNTRWNKINHLIYDSQKYNFNQNSLNKNELFDVDVFIESAGIDKESLEINKELVFMLTPFHNNEWETFTTVREVCNNLSFKCIRGDEKHIEGDILPSIIKSILEARIIIVNVNGRNPNVLYELGVAHALGKRTILISKFGDELPFDVKSKNVILYKDLSELKEKLKDALFKVIL